RRDGPIGPRWKRRSAAGRGGGGWSGGRGRAGSRRGLGRSGSSGGAGGASTRAGAQEQGQRGEQTGGAEPGVHRALLQAVPCGARVSETRRRRAAGRASIVWAESTRLVRREQ